MNNWFFTENDPFVAISVHQLRRLVIYHVVALLVDSIGIIRIILDDKAREEVLLNQIMIIMNSRTFMHVLISAERLVTRILR